MLFYAEKMSQGVPLPKPNENIHDDPQQVVFNLDAAVLILLRLGFKIFCVSQTTMNNS